MLLTKKIMSSDSQTLSDGIKQVPRFVPPEPTNQYNSAPTKSPEKDQDLETHRRLDQTKTGFETPAGITAPPLQNDNHALVLLNFTHQGHRPRSTYPGFRVLGAFPTEGAVKQHIHQHYEDSDCSLFVTPAHQLTVVCASTERQQDSQHNKMQIETLVELHNNSVEKRDADFQKNIEESKTGKTGQSLFAREYQTRQKKNSRVELMEKKFEETITKLKKTSTLPSTCCIAKQNFAAVIILTDIRPTAASGEKDKEPALAVLGVFATEEDATNYAKYTASKQYPKCAIDVVDMYGWCFPENIDTEKIKEVYGNDQLNDIMQGRKDQQKTTDQFQEWCKENKIEPEVTEIGEEIKQPVSVDEQL